MLRSHKIGEVTEKLSGKKVELCGWIDSIRYFKSRVFLVLRDRYGKIQCIIVPLLNSMTFLQSLNFCSQN